MSLELIREHPWITGGVILGGGILLYLYWRGGSSSGIDGTTSTGSTALDPVAAQLQMASMAASAAQEKTQAELQVAQERLALQGKALDAAKETALNHDTTQALMAKYQNDTAYAMQQSSNQAAISAAHINADSSASDSAYAAQVAMANIEAQLEATKVNAQTTVDVTELTTTRDMNVTQINATRDTTVNAQSVQGAVDIAQINATRDATINEQNIGGAVAINADNNTTERLGISTMGNIYTDYIEAGKQVAIHQTDIEGATYQAMIAANAKTKSDITDLLDAGALGNANRASVATAILGQPAVGVAIQNQQAVNGPTGTMAGIGAMLAGAGKFFVPGVTP